MVREILLQHNAVIFRLHFELQSDKKNRIEKQSDIYFPV